MKLVNPKPKKCKVCHSEFLAWMPMQQVCKPQCALELVRLNKKKKLNKEAKERKRTFREHDKKYHAERAKKACHDYIRYRDRNKPCVSSGVMSGVLFQAGHYKPSGNNASLRYCEWNIHKQCAQDNLYKSGNLTDYRIELIKRIGLPHVEYLESQNEPYRYTIDDLKEIKAYYIDKLKWAKLNDQ